MLHPSLDDLVHQLFTVSADGGDGDDGGEHKSLPVRLDRPCHRESCAAGEQNLQIYNIVRKIIVMIIVIIIIMIIVIIIIMIFLTIMTLLHPWTS